MAPPLLNAPTLTAASEPVPNAGLTTGASRQHRHVAQFYEQDEFLARAATDYLAAGLRSGEPVIVIATPDHAGLILTQLHARGFSATELGARGWIEVLDARETLAAFMAGQMPDVDRFISVVGAVIDKAFGATGASHVRAYGEMVDLLVESGNPDGAIRLEQLWNQLAASRSFSLMCGYALERFATSTAARPFESICAEHTHVQPSERYVALDDDAARLREITILQQRARALETEIEHRKRMEGELRRALVDRDRAEAEREHLLRREQTARREAETASRLKDEFLAVLSHELRTPLNAILGWAHIITEPRSDAGMWQRALDVIKRNATLQLHVIDDLLDVSRMMTGKLRLVMEPVDLVETIGAAIDTARPAADAKDISVSFDQDDPAFRLVNGDRDRLQQVMWNLLSNAIKFTPAQGRVTVRLESSGDSARIVVTDTGQGISASFLPHVFDRFRQADSGHTRLHGGLGLGLAVVRSLVEAHGGEVTAASDGEGRGASFVVTLPKRQVSRAPVVPSSGGTLAAFEGARVLVVDDDSDTRELFAHLLTRRGAKVEAVASAQQALELLAAPRFDLLVGDVGLPGRDGYHLIDAIRTHALPAVRRLRALAVTSYAGDHYRARAIGAGYDEYMTKPIDPGRFEQVVGELLQRKA